MRVRTRLRISKRRKRVSKFKGIGGSHVQVPICGPSTSASKSSGRGNAAKAVQFFRAMQIVMVSDSMVSSLIRIGDRL